MNLVLIWANRYNPNKLMNVFEFTEKTMGTEIPTLTDFKLMESSTSGCMITCQVDYSGDAYFEAEIGASFGKITIGIKDISFKGPLMIGTGSQITPFCMFSFGSLFLPELRP